MYRTVIAALAIFFAFGTAHAAQAPKKKAEAPAKGEAKKDAKKSAVKEEEVTFKTADGWQLKGTYFPGKPGAPVVLLLHKLGSNRSEFIGLAKMLQEKGMNALAYDGRGHGESTEKDGKKVTYETFSNEDFANMTGDIDAALKFLHTQKKIGKVPVGIVGASIQSSTGLVYASQHPEVKALVMLSPGLDYHGIQTVAPMKAYDGRPVYIASSIDDSPSYKASKTLEGIATGPKKRETLSDGGHGAEMFRKDPKLQERVAAWLSENLK